jgi:hypothetical protein
MNFSFSEQFKAKAEEVSSNVFLSGNTADNISYITSVLKRVNISRVAL